ncbi:MAG TPA: LysM peptidoglycan-binding domain-containing protein [Candidatus Polarisedimenticolaceae bacterium]|nr:LysM peptidoglycan-binding domain-containing protein [Candidatus Polarisedimenticolaceae bacterium]
MTKAGRVATLVLSGLVVAGLGIAAETSSRPPENLKKVGDHWTPWDPPPAAEGDYLIQPNDTLWDLSGKWLSNPYLWPQIWEQNRYVQDSHWIYPGDPLKVPGQPTVVPPNAEPPVDDQDQDQAGAPAAQATPAPSARPVAPESVPLADPSDLYCSGYVDPEHQVPDTLVVGHELEREHNAQGDVIYLNRGRNQGVAAGAVFGVERPTYQVVHPTTGEELGVMVRRLARVRVLAAQADTAVAVIEMSCDYVHTGDELVAWQERTPPMVSSLPHFDRYDLEPSGGKQGEVVATRDPIHAAGTGHIIYTDFGQDSGVTPGEVITLYREGEEGTPRRMIGQAVVLSVEPTTSMAKITTAVRETAVGDHVETRR